MTAASNFFQDNFPAVHQAIEWLRIIFSIIDDYSLVAFYAHLVFRIREILRGEPPIDGILRYLFDGKRCIFFFVTFQPLDDCLPMS